MSKEPTKTELPYNTDIDLLEKILDDLKNTGKDGVKLDTLWVNLNATKSVYRSYTINLAKFLGLVDSDNTKVWLTDLGTKLRYGTKEERTKVLVANMPEKYLSMFKWILGATELRSNEIKNRYIDAWGTPKSTIILDRSIASFLGYCRWLGIINYIGRGNQAKAVVTDLGRKVLDSVPQKIEPSNESNDQKHEPKTNGKTTLPENTTYPIIIKTKDRDFDWDVKSETDWAVIDSVINSIKEGWKKNQPRGEV